MEQAIIVKEPHEAVKNALRSTGQSYGQLSKTTGYSRAYLCLVANGRAKLTQKFVQRLLACGLPVQTLISACPTCGKPF